MNTLSQAAQVVSSVHSAASTAQSIGSLASLVQQLSSSASSSSPTLSSDDQSSKTSSFVSQLINGLSTLNAMAPPSGPQGLGGQATTLSGSLPASGTSNFSPLIAVLDFLASSDKSPVSSLLPARRKKPFDLEDLASEAAAAMNANKVPPTPCPSLEEYIAPVFARNYQGVWKYIVQIPHEGYFTQTVQKTSCL